MKDSSGVHRYDRHAQFEMFLKRIRSTRRPHLSFHRRFRTVIQREGPRDGLYELVDTVIDGFFGKTVVDAGCGFGGLTAWCAVHKKTGVLGITLSERQVAVSRGYLERYGVRGDWIQLGDYNSLPADSFDVIVAIESLIHSDDLHRSLACFRSALLPGGCVVVVDDFWLESDETLISELNRLGWGVGEGLILEKFLSACSIVGLRRVKEIDITHRVWIEPPWVTRLLMFILRRLPCRPSGFAASRRDFYLAFFTLNREIQLGRSRYRLVRLDQV